MSVVSSLAPELLFEAVPVVGLVDDVCEEDFDFEFDADFEPEFEDEWD